MARKRQSLLILALISTQLAGLGWRLSLAAEVKPGSAGVTGVKDSMIKGGMGPVSFLRFSPNGGELVRVCMFGPVVLFDPANYKKGRTFPIGLRMIAYSPDGKSIATAEGRDGARVWDAAEQGKRLPKSLLKELHVLETPLQILEAPGQGEE